MEELPTGLPINPAPEEKVPSPQETERRIQEEAMARFLAENPDRAREVEARLANIPIEGVFEERRKESGPAIASLESLMSSFEVEHPLAELQAIVDLKPEDAAKNPVRESAKTALIPIVAALNALKVETDITEAEYQAIKAKYRRLSQAVGIMSGGKVDHTR